MRTDRSPNDLDDSYARGYADGLADAERQTSKALAEVYERLRAARAAITTSLPRPKAPERIDFDVLETLRFYGFDSPYGQSTPDGGQRARTVLRRIEDQQEGDAE